MNQDNNTLLSAFYSREFTGIAANTAIELAYDLSVNSWQDQQHFRRLLLRLIAQMEFSGKISEGTLQGAMDELRSEHAKARALIAKSIEAYLAALRSVTALKPIQDSCYAQPVPLSDQDHP